MSASGWRSYFGGGSRYSPFHTPQSRSPPTVTEDDYHYLGPGDIVDPPRAVHLNTSSSSYFPTSSRLASRADAANPNAPDILTIKHRNTTYPLHFPAFSIGEGQLRVGELRKLAAEKIGCNSRQIKLLYKGKALRDNSLACREEGLKQNSELMAVVSEAPLINGRGEDESSESASESDMANGAVRVDVDGTLVGGPKKPRKGHRGGKKNKNRRDGDSGTTTEGRNSPMPGPLPGSRDGPSQSQSPTSQPQQSGAKSGAMSKLEELSSIFHTKFVPQCVQYLTNPPSDPKARDMEHKKLSETILAQIILKLDEVNTEGNEEARARRKALVKETQAMLNSLDDVVKK
ncbi:hypothetical protein MMC30_005786 [Trapelia coarctata]|nr:hypothetical protein [Trapelia coarctata]